MTPDRLGKLLAADALLNTAANIINEVRVLSVGDPRDEELDDLHRRIIVKREKIGDMIRGAKS